MCITYIKNKGLLILSDEITIFDDIAPFDKIKRYLYYLSISMLINFVIFIHAFIFYRLLYRICESVEVELVERKADEPKLFVGELEIAGVHRFDDRRKVLNG
jgi:hypothetical protein